MQVETRTVALLAVDYFVDALAHLPSSYSSDRELVLAAVKKRGSQLRHASEELKDSREVVMEALSNDCWTLQHASGRLRHDPTVLLDYVERYGETLLFPTSLKMPDSCAFRMEALGVSEDRDGFLSAVRYSPAVLEFAPNHIKDVAEVVMAAVGKSGACLEFASRRLRATRSVVRAASYQSGYSLEFASKKMRADRSFVMSVLRLHPKQGGVLEFASDELKYDRSFVMEAVRIHGSAFFSAPSTFWNDREILLAALESGDYDVLGLGSSLYSATFQHAAFLQDFEVVMAAAKGMKRVSGTHYAHWWMGDMPDAFKANRDLFLAAVTKSGIALRYASEGVRSDREVVLAAVRCEGEAMQYASDDLKADVQVVLEAVANRGMAFMYTHLQKVEEVLLLAVEKDAKVLANVSPCKLRNRFFMLSAVERNGLALRYASPALRGDYEVVLSATMSKGGAICYASGPMQRDERVLYWAKMTTPKRRRWRKWRGRALVIEVVLWWMEAAAKTAELRYRADVELRFVDKDGGGPSCASNKRPKYVVDLGAVFREEGFQTWLAVV